MPIRDWFVTGSHHREVCELYRQRLAVAQEQAAEERARADREMEIRRELETKVIEGLFSKPAPAEPRRVHRAPEDKVTHVEIPIDLDDEQAIVKQAIRETGSRNARVIAARAQHIRDRLSKGQRITRKTPLKMPIPQVDELIQSTLREAEQEAYAQSQVNAAAARHAAS